MSAIANFMSAIGPVLGLNATETYSSGSSATHTVSFTLNSDGTYEVESTVNGAIDNGRWLLPPGAVPSDYAVTATLISESTFTGSPAHTGTFGSSLSLTSNRTWTQTVASDPADASTLVFDLNFTRSGSSFGGTIRIDLTVG